MKHFISAGLQILGFCFFFAFFVEYYRYRKGIEVSEFINKGSKMYRDESGVPHIQAETLRDAYFTEGFVHAEDRLWQMVFSYKVGTGQISELFGKDALPLDKFSRLLNLKEVCTSAISTLNEEEYNTMKSYSDGVNHYINTVKILPFEFLLFGINASNLKWEPSSSCVVTQLVQYYLTYDFYEELLRSFFFEQGILEKDVIEKIFPFRYDLYEYKRTVVKGDEMKNYKIDRTIKIEKEVKPVKTEVKSNDLEEKSNLESVKKEAIEETINNTDNRNEENQENPSKINEYLNKEKGIGSNNFVISGKHTENGHPYVCNDPHLQNSIPTLWYFINMSIKNSKQESQLIGASIPGVPSIFIGTNSYVAWGITNGMVDSADIVRVEKSKFDKNLSLRLNPEDISAESVKSSTSPLNLIKREETIFLNNDRSEYIKVDFYDSEIGPVLNGHSGSLFVVSGKEIPKENFNEKQYYYILRASILDKKDTTLKFLTNIISIKDGTSFRQLLAKMTLSLNIVYSDKQDNIGYQLTGKIPIKTGEEDGAYIKTITKLEDLNLDFIPYEELPHLVNPERGFIVTSNNLLIDVDYKHRMQGGFILDSRAIALEDEIERMIKNKEKINAKLINEHLLKNVKDYYCKDTLKLIYGIFIKEKAESKLNINEAFKNLFTFDCEMKGESREALLFNVWENEIHHSLHYTKNIEKFSHDSKIRIIEASERANYLTYKLKQYLDNPAICQAEYSMTCGEFFIKNFINAVETIENNLGNNVSEWKWMDMNIKHYPHKPFSLIPGLKMLAHRTVKTDGNCRTPKISLSKWYDKKLEAKISSNLKFIINLYDYQNQTFFSIDTGQNGRIFHKHYDDFLVNHEKGALIKVDPIIRDNKFTLEFRNKNPK